MTKTILARFWGRRTLGKKLESSSRLLDEKGKVYYTKVALKSAAIRMLTGSEGVVLPAKS